MSEQSYPVIVEYTERHLVWVAADGPDTAERWVRETPWEFTRNGQSFDGWASVSAPKDEYDWDAIYNGWDGAAEEPDHHVHVHRAEQFRRELAAKQAACHEARHPDVTVCGTGSIWCRGCTEYLYVADSEWSS